MAEDHEIAIVLIAYGVVGVNLAHRLFRVWPNYETKWWVELLVLPTWTVWLVIIPFLLVLAEGEIRGNQNL